MTYFFAFLVNSWIHVPGGAWQPSAEQVHEVQQLLRPYVEENAVAWREELPPWERYTIQYQGEVRDGRNVLFINAMCDEPPVQVNREMVYTFDGGPCFFRTYWIPGSREFLDFSFNGYG